MKKALKRLYDVPLLGYLLRAIVGLAKLPIHMSSHEESLRELQQWLPHAEGRISQAASRQDSTESRVFALEVGNAEVQRLSTEAHGQATYLTHRLEATAQQVARVEESIGRLQAGLDRHLPVVLGFISSNSVVTRELHREQQALRREAGALLARFEALESSSAATKDAHQTDARRMSEIENRLALTGKLQPPQGAGPALLADPGQSIGPLRTAIDELRSNVSYLLQRIEFVRRETLFELRYGKAPSARQSTEVDPRIVNAAKVSQCVREGLRVNVGSGHLPMEGYVNVDLRELPGVDVIAEAGRMPFDPGSIVELHSAHLLEHFPREQLRREILPYWKSLLRKDGALRAVVPDAATMIDKYKGGEMPWEDLREVTFGGQDYAGDFHFDMFTPESLKALLEEAGLRDVTFPVIGRANGRCYEMEVRARA